jgi:TRAP-type C4-dicarboxylate transport system permease small subunit
VTNFIRVMAYTAASVSAVCVFLMMVLTFVDVSGRYLFKRPITGAGDITELLMILAVFLAMAYTQVMKGHVAVEVLVSKLSMRKQVILDAITSFLSGVIVVLISARLCVRAWVSFVNPYTYKSVTIGIPLWPFILIAAIGCLILCLCLLLNFFNCLSLAARR